VCPPWGARFALTAFALSWAVGWLPLLAAQAVGLRPPFPWGSIYIELAMVGAVLALSRRLRMAWSAADLGWRPAAPRSAAGWAVLALIGANILRLLYALAVDLPAVANPFAHRHGSVTIVAMGIAAIVLAPIAEESVFRGVIYGGLRQSWPVPLAALVSAALFGFVHWSFGIASEPLLIAPMQASFGLAACLLYERTGSLYPGMAIHAYFNASIFAGTGYLPLGLPFLVAVLAIVACLVAPALPQGRARSYRPALGSQDDP
jgi:membrane protease YdiL (CAAX protease family)